MRATPFWAPRFVGEPIFLYLLHEVCQIHSFPLIYDNKSWTLNIPMVLLLALIVLFLGTEKRDSLA